MSELLYNDPYAQIVHEIDTLDDQTIVIHTSGDVQPVLDANKHDANHSSNWSKDRSLKHVARVPVEIYMIWLHKLGVDMLNPDHGPAVQRLLNSNEWGHLRTGGGTL